VEGKIIKIFATSQLFLFLILSGFSKFYALLFPTGFHKYFPIKVDLVKQLTHKFIKILYIVIKNETSIGKIFSLR